MEIVSKIVEEIARELQKSYKWPIIFAVELYEINGIKYGNVMTLWKRADRWYVYGEPANPAFALMHEGIREIPEELELNLVEVVLKHVESRKVVFPSGDTEDLHIYEALPVGPAVKVYAKTKNGNVVLDTSQLRQYVEMHLR